jgi:hypothetical protein
MKSLVLSQWVLIQGFILTRRVQGAKGRTMGLYSEKTATCQPRREASGGPKPSQNMVARIVRK